MTLVEHVRETIERHGMFRAGQRIGVAVSGGADSVCLLEVLRELAEGWRLGLTVLHLDHGLRGEESRRDAEFVAEMAARLGLPAIVRRAELAGAAGNLEEAGREARLEFFREAMAGGAVERVALGHTRRDQAETVLFRILRGAGTAGLAGIRPVTTEGIVRPLLEVGRGEVEEFLRARGVAWREDASNETRRFARNRIRHELMPQLAREWNPQIEETLAQMAEWARAEEAYWAEEVERIGRRNTEPDGSVVLDTTELRRLPEAAARRVVRRAIEQAKGDLRGVDFVHVEAVLALARRVSGNGAVQAAGVEVRRSFEWMRVARAGARAEPYCFRVKPPAAVAVPGTGRVIRLELLENLATTGMSDSVYNGEMGCLDWGRVAAPIRLRNWRPGDRFEPMSGTGPQKIKNLFQAARIPAWERAQWPVLTDGASVLWTRRFGVAAVAAPRASSRVVLRIREETSAVSGVKSESGMDERASKRV